MVLLKGELNAFPRTWNFPDTEIISDIDDVKTTAHQSLVNFKAGPASVSDTY